MNPLTNMKNVKKLSQQELETNYKTSWHDQYRDSAWIFVGGLPYDLTEGDVICVFSQYGEIVNLNLVREKGTGKSRGFCFICYEDQRSTVLAVDNLNGIKILGRIIRVDHVANYKAPKDIEKMTEETRRLHEEGCALTLRTNIKSEPLSPPRVSVKVEPDVTIKKEKVKVKAEQDKDKTQQGKQKRKSKEKRRDKKKKKKRQNSRSDSESSPSSC